MTKTTAPDTADLLVRQLREEQPVTQDMASTMQCALQDAAAARIEALERALDEIITEATSRNHAIDIARRARHGGVGE